MTIKQKQLIEYATQDLVALTVERDKLDSISAMDKVYHSALYEKLQDPETGLYLEGSDYRYNLFKEGGIRKEVTNL